MEKRQKETNLTKLLIKDACVKNQYDELRDFCDRFDREVSPPKLDGIQDIRVGAACRDASSKYCPELLKDLLDCIPHVEPRLYSARFDRNRETPRSNFAPIKPLEIYAPSQVVTVVEDYLESYTEQVKHLRTDVEFNPLRSSYLRNIYKARQLQYLAKKELLSLVGRRLPQHPSELMDASILYCRKSPDFTPTVESDADGSTSASPRRPTSPIPATQHQHRGKYWKSMLEEEEDDEELRMSMARRRPPPDRRMTPRGSPTPMFGESQSTTTAPTPSQMHHPDFERRVDEIPTSLPLRQQAPRPLRASISDTAIAAHQQQLQQIHQKVPSAALVYAAPCEDVGAAAVDSWKAAAIRGVTQFRLQQLQNEKVQQQKQQVQQIKIMSKPAPMQTQQPATQQSHLQAPPQQLCAKPAATATGPRLPSAAVTAAPMWPPTSTIGSKPPTASMWPPPSTIGSKAPPARPVSVIWPTAGGGVKVTTATPTLQAYALTGGQTRQPGMPLWTRPTQPGASPFVPTTGVLGRAMASTTPTHNGSPLMAPSSGPTPGGAGQARSGVLVPSRILEVKQLPIQLVSARAASPGATFVTIPASGVAKPIVQPMVAVGQNSPPRTKSVVTTSTVIGNNALVTGANANSNNNNSALAAPTLPEKPTPQSPHHWTNGGGPFQVALPGGKLIADNNRIWMDNIVSMLEQKSKEGKEAVKKT